MQLQNSNLWVPVFIHIETTSRKPKQCVQCSDVTACKTYSHIHVKPALKIDDLTVEHELDSAFKWDKLFNHNKLCLSHGIDSRNLEDGALIV